MIDFLKFLLQMTLASLPFVLFTLLNHRANLKKQIRNRQMLMPLLALLYVAVVVLFMPRITELIVKLWFAVPNWLNQFGMWITRVTDGNLDFLGRLFRHLSGWLRELLNRINVPFWVCFFANGVIMLVYLIYKKLALVICSAALRKSQLLAEKIGGLFYTHDEDNPEIWYVKPHFGQGRSFLKAFYWGCVVMSVLSLLVSGFLYRHELLRVPFYPVFGIILLGEIFFFLDGLTKAELQGGIEGEEEDSRTVCNFSLIRKTLRKLFGDKLQAEDTNASSGEVQDVTCDELLRQLTDSPDPALEAYGNFMQSRVSGGMELDRNYLASGAELLQGKSILFNNPFYYDLVPYVSYPMNRTLLKHRKVLIVLGRHSTEEDVEKWCREGFREVTNLESMWKVGVLSDTPADLDVGIVTRSSVHDLKLHEANAEFFSQVEFVMLMEPSRLLSTAQIGLNSLIRFCRRDGKNLTFCSVDKNCDGLLDALAHVLMCSLTQVAATNRYEGVCSYMCWETDRDHLQHRMLPNLSRYLGVGTELSFAALKLQVPETFWYGGEAFPVTDMHWIVTQYYYDLLHYAGLPATQKMIEDTFHVSPNYWNAKRRENLYITVEDEDCNMFEVKRNFSTRATGQSFINIISPEYLLKDYMAENRGIFNSDPKAIPCIVADYARTVRNVVMRLCLRMSSGVVNEEELHRELMLIDADSQDPRKTLWELVCDVNQRVGCPLYGDNGERLLEREEKGHTFKFGPDTIRTRRKFSMKLGVMQTIYFIDDSAFRRILLQDLQNAGCIAEDENGERQYLGSELRGQVFQKYLPGQFFTFGGKYYEMLTVTADGQVLARRAADHITGRPSYRQVREYVISNAVDSEAMGDQRTVGELRIVKQFADFTVKTPAYWQMDKYNDFENGRKVTLNGIPDRTYYNKQILRIDLPEGTDHAVCTTLVLLLNEVFRTVFADNQHYITALMAGQAREPLTCSLRGAEGFSVRQGSIYLIEDSQLDMGLLITAERSLPRLLEIICDYLRWHMDEVEKSKNPPPQPEPEDYTVPEGEPQEEKPKSWIGRVWQKIKNFFKAIGRFFKKIGRAIANFFRKLFGKKPKEPVPQDGGTPAEGEAPQGGGTPAEGEAPQGGETPAEGEIPQEEGDIPREDPIPTAVDPDDDGDISGVEDIPTYHGSRADTPRILGSVSIHGSSEGDPTIGDDEPNDANDTLEFEPEQVHKPGMKEMKRPPYHERFYLLYGGREVPEQLDLQQTYDLLAAWGFADGSLKQARDGKDIADMIEKNYDPQKPGSHFCDFCGVELLGSDYDVLSDGRERCRCCSRTAVKSSREFEAIYRTIARNMEAFYGARITVPIHVQMANAKKVNKACNHTFVPTGKFDGRVLGVAIKDRNGYRILVENGSPRLSSIMTIAHEMTHIWQYTHWDMDAISRMYGKELELEVYEGMAKWVEIQYAYLIGETATAKREEICTRLRDDEYGRGFLKYVKRYPLSEGTHLEHLTPFDDVKKPL